MSQASLGRNEIEAALIAKAQAEPQFRAALLKDPRAAIEKELGVALPAGTELKVVEETPTTNYLILPAAADGELSDRDLDTVAGGWASIVAALAKKPSSVQDITFGIQKDKMQSANKNAEATRSLL